MAYTFPQKVLFKHCDPAGIVFFPRYFEMMNDCVEVFFADKLSWPFEEMHSKHGVPTASISTRFAAPSRHGDHLILTLFITKLGTTSLGYRMQAHCGDELRFDTDATIVHIGENGRPTAWPDAIHSTLSALKEEHA